MRCLLACLVAIPLALGVSSAEAKTTKRKPRAAAAQQDNSPSAIAERQRHASTFDETQYFERDSNKIPFGTRAWWEQKTRENPDN